MTSDLMPAQIEALQTLCRTGALYAWRVVRPQGSSMILWSAVSHDSEVARPPRLHEDNDGRTCPELLCGARVTTSAAALGRMFSVLTIRRLVDLGYAASDEPAVVRPTAQGRDACSRIVLHPRGVVRARYDRARAARLRRRRENFENTGIAERLARGRRREW